MKSDKKTAQSLTRSVEPLTASVMNPWLQQTQIPCGAASRKCGRSHCHWESSKQCAATNANSIGATQMKLKPALLLGFSNKLTWRLPVQFYEGK